MVKFITPEQAAQLVQDGATAALGGFGAYCGADALLDALSRRFQETRHPANITVFTGISTGDNSQGDMGMNRIAREGLIGTLIAAHMANPPKISAMAAANQIAAYALPLGVVAQLFRAIAGKKPGVVTRVGLNIVQDGPGVKFIDKVQQITFSADYARKTGQDVTYVTERAVFKLAEGGIMLTEIAPGVDLEKDILAHMEFRPLLADEIKTMDARIFHEEKMGLHF